MKYHFAIALSVPLLTAGSAILQAPQTPAQVRNAGVPMATVPIQDLLQQGPGVTIAGEITSVVGNEFILSDGTGSLIVDAGPLWYHRLNLQVGELVTVTGEYDDEDFDAFTITRETGEVLTIREPQGPPPWAGGPHRQRDRQD